MKKKRFSVQQIVGVLKQAEVAWKAKYVGLEVDQVRQPRRCTQPSPDRFTRPRPKYLRLFYHAVLLADIT
jgi:hypothetical protein